MNRLQFSTKSRPHVVAGVPADSSPTVGLAKASSTGSSKVKPRTASASPAEGKKKSPAVQPQAKAKGKSSVQQNKENQIMNECDNDGVSVEESNDDENEIEGNEEADENEDISYEMTTPKVLSKSGDWDLIRNLWLVIFNLNTAETETKNDTNLAQYLEKIRSTWLQENDHLPDDPFYLFSNHHDEWFRTLALSKAHVDSYDLDLIRYSNNNRNNYLNGLNMRRRFTKLKQKVTKFQGYVKKCTSLLNFNHGVPDLKSGVTIYMVLNWILKKNFNDSVTTEFVVWCFWGWPCSYIWDGRESNISFYGLAEVDSLPAEKKNRSTQRLKELEETKTDIKKRKVEEIREEGLQLKKEYFEKIVDQGKEQNRIAKGEFILKEKDSVVSQIESIMRNMEKSLAGADSCNDENQKMFYKYLWEKGRSEIIKLEEKKDLLERKMQIFQEEEKGEDCNF